MDVTVTLKGSFFGADIPRIVQKQIQHEIFAKVEERTQRQGKGKAAQKNTISHDRQGFHALEVGSTLKSYRTKGTSWQKKNVAIIKSMAPRIANKAAQRIAEELR